MTSRKIKFHPEAISEAAAAATWYRERNPLVADAFLNEIDQTINLTR